LVVDPDRILSLSVGLQRFKAVTLWDSKVADHAGLIQQTKFPQRYVLDVRRQFAAPPAGPDQLRLWVGKALNRDRP
jgi:hypothetical protein